MGAAVKSRRAFVAVVVAVLVVASSACGDPAYQFVSNRELGNYFKVPSSWTMQDDTETQSAGRPEAQQSGVVSLWRLLLLNDDNANGLDRDSGGSPAEVFGRAEIYGLSSYYNDDFSRAKIRALLFSGVDPLYPAESLQSRYETVDHLPLTAGEGINGSRVIANVDMAEDGANPRWETYDASFLFDNTLGRVYVLLLHCTSDCYEANRAAIDEVATSWTVRT